MLMSGAGPMVTRLVWRPSPSPSATSRPRPVRSTTAATACVWQTEGGWDTGVSATPAMKVRPGTSFLYETCMYACCVYRYGCLFLVFYLFMETTLLNRIVCFETNILQAIYCAGRDMEIECMTKLYWMKTN